MRHALVLLLSAFLGLAMAEEGLNARIETAVKAFEDQVGQDFAPVERWLDQWRQRRRSLALQELTTLLAKAADEDKPYVAYHLLAGNPRHKQARAVFAELGTAAPFDEKGVPAAGWTIPACRNPDLVERISASAYPPFGVVSEAVYAPNVKAYYKRTAEQLGRLKATLIDLAKAGTAEASAAAVFPILSYYHPEAIEVRMHFGSKGRPVPRQRVWFNPVDRWLLDRELAGIDCLDARIKPLSGSVRIPGKGQPAQLQGTTTWGFPEYLRSCRIEGVLSSPGGASLTLADDHGRGATLAIAPKRLVLTATGAKAPLGEFPLDIDLAAAAAPVQLEARGSAITVRVGGLVVGGGTLPAPVAFHRATVVGPLTAPQLRVRYLAEVQEAPGDAIAKPVAKPETPAEPAWMADRRKDLDKPLTFDFSDTPIEEVVGMLGRLTGTSFTLDESAATLKSLPISLTGSDMPLRTAIDWVTRFSGLEAVPQADGFRFTWKKG